MRKFSLLLAGLLFIGAHTVNAQEETDVTALEVSRIEIATDIEGKEPVGVANAFPDTTPKLYCFTHITGAQEPTKITHRWLRGDKVMAEVTLNVKSSSWRTRSSKNLWKGWTGVWKVEVLDEDGNVLKDVTFTLDKTEE